MPSATKNREDTAVNASYDASRDDSRSNSAANASKTKRESSARADRIYSDGSGGRIRGDKPTKDKQDNAVQAAVEEKASLPRKAAAAVGIAGLVGVGAAAYMGHKTYTAARTAEGDIANAIGDLIMEGASRFERRLPAIGAPKLTQEDRENGWDFDV